MSTKKIVVHNVKFALLLSVFVMTIIFVLHIVAAVWYKWQTITNIKIINSNLKDHYQVALSYDKVYANVLFGKVNVIVKNLEIVSEDRISLLINSLKITRPIGKQKTIEGVILGNTTLKTRNGKYDLRYNSPPKISFDFKDNTLLTLKYTDEGYDSISLKSYQVIERSKSNLISYIRDENSDQIVVESNIESTANKQLCLDCKPIADPEQIDISLTLNRKRDAEGKTLFELSFFNLNSANVKVNASGHVVIQDNAVSDAVAFVNIHNHEELIDQIFNSVSIKYEDVDSASMERIYKRMHKVILPIITKNNYNKKEKNLRLVIDLDQLTKELRINGVALKNIHTMLN